MVPPENNNTRRRWAKQAKWSVKECMVDLVKNFWANESGGTAIEYSMIATAISIAILASLLVLRDTLSGDYYDRIAEAFTNL